MNRIYYKKAFTLAEVLITLTVIGIVAALSIPALTQNMNEKAWKTQKKALYSRLSAAVLSMPKVAGYGTYSSVKNEETGKTEITDNVAESFIVEGLSKTYKVNNVCTAENMEQCGISSKYTKIDGTKADFPKTYKELTGYSGTTTMPAAFQTVNGESLALFYGYSCAQRSDYSVNGWLGWPCAVFVYDLNGTKAPNQIGKDMGVISALYGPDGLEVVSVNPYDQVNIGKGPLIGDNGTDALSLCKKKSKDLRIPKFTELNAFVYSEALFHKDKIGGFVWSSTTTSLSGNGKAISVNPSTGERKAETKDVSNNILCVYE